MFWLEQDKFILTLSCTILEIYIVIFRLELAIHLLLFVKQSFKLQVSHAMRIRPTKKIE